MKAPGFFARARWLAICLLQGGQNIAGFRHFWGCLSGRFPLPSRRLAFWERDSSIGGEKDGAEESNGNSCRYSTADVASSRRAITSMMFFYGGPLMTDGYHPVCKPHASPPQPWNVSYRVH